VREGISVDILISDFNNDTKVRAQRTAQRELQAQRQ
jgi:hypothetical protein